MMIFIDMCLLVSGFAIGYFFYVHYHLRSELNYILTTVKEDIQHLHLVLDGMITKENK